MSTASNLNSDAGFDTGSAPVISTPALELPNNYLPAAPENFSMEFAPERPRFSPLAVTSFVLGLIAVPAFFGVFIAGAFSAGIAEARLRGDFDLIYMIATLVLAVMPMLLGIVFGIVGIVQTARKNRRGLGFAIAGLVTSLASIAFLVYLISVIGSAASRA